MATSRAVGFLLVLALSTTVISAVPDGAITAKTPTTEAKTEETESTAASLAPDIQNDHSNTSVVSTESKTEKAGTQHSPTATPPRQEMVREQVAGIRICSAVGKICFPTPISSPGHARAMVLRRTVCRRSTE